MRNIKLILEYDGTAYSGWQIQPNGITVQSLLQKVVRKMTGEETKVIGASRTDAGVHALGQAANFKTSSKISCFGFLRGLNSMLPADISVKSVEDVSPDFHAKKSAKGKHYRYLLYLGGSRPAILRDKVWWLRKFQLSSPTPNLYGEEMGRVVRPLIGIHDFSAFCAAGDANRCKIREIFDIKVDVASEIPAPCLLHAGTGFAGMVGGQLLAIDIKGNGFLKYMVRNIVGTVVESLSLPEGKRVKFIKSVLAGKDRKKAGVTAPASGLYLVKVIY